MRDEIDLGIDNLTEVTEIGRGGFSVVYSATNTLLGTRVAVKLLEKLSEEADRRRFERECQVMGRLSHHHNVVTVHHAGYTSSGNPYLIMELVDGGSVGDRLDRTGPMNWAEAIDHVVPIAGALAYVHEAGILHRDVKPENILIGTDRQPLLTDFGIARLGDSATNTSSGIAASWLHAPPETFDDKREARSDLYSLASTLHQMVSGHPPFWRGVEESLNPLMYRLIHEPPPRLGPEIVPPAMADTIQRALAKSPVDRHPAVQAFADELTSIRRGSGPAPVAAATTVVASAPAGFVSNPRDAAQRPANWFDSVSPTVSSGPPLVDDVVGRPATGAPGTTRSWPIVAGVILAISLLAGGAVGVSLLAQQPTDDNPVETTTESAEAVTTTAIAGGEPELAVDAGSDVDSRLDAVIERGVLDCGVNDSLPGFGVQLADGTYEGFDIDFCRVVAAVLGNAEAVNFVPLAAADRFTALQVGDIDVLIRNTSQTASRTGEQNVEFPLTTFFDGQALMLRSSAGAATIEDLAGASICTIGGTTTELTIGDVVAGRGIDAQVLVFESNDPLMAAYLAGDCDAWTADTSLLASFRAQFPEPSDHVILPELFTSEPLGPVVASGDDRWSKAVEWAILATIQAWQAGIDSTNVATFEANDPTSIIITGGTDFDPGLGLQPRYPRLVVEQVGNYAEIYDRNFAGRGLPLEGSANDLAANGGLMFAPPLR